MNEPKQRRSLLCAVIILFGYLWFVLIDELHLAWSVYPQYSYGWSVPLLCGILFWQRWLDRPPAEQPIHAGLIGTAACFLSLAFLPTRFLQEAFPDWRRLDWALGLEVTGISLYAIYLAGGLRWVKHFAFP